MIKEKSKTSRELHVLLGVEIVDWNGKLAMDVRD